MLNYRRYKVNFVLSFWQTYRRLESGEIGLWQNVDILWVGVCVWGNPSLCCESCTFRFVFKCTFHLLVCLRERERLMLQILQRIDVYRWWKLLFTETKLVICLKVVLLLFPLTVILLDPILETVKGKTPPWWLISKWKNTTHMNQRFHSWPAFETTQITLRPWSESGLKMFNRRSCGKLAITTLSSFD